MIWNLYVLCLIAFWRKHLLYLASGTFFCWGFELCFEKLIKLHHQTDPTESYCCVHRSNLDLCCAKLVGFFFQRIVFQQTVVVVRHHQNNQLSHVADVCSVVLVCLFERQVYEVVHDEKDAEGQNHQGRQNVLCFHCDVVPQGKPVS